MKATRVLFLSVAGAGFLFVAAPARACCSDTAASAAAADERAGSVTTGSVCTLRVEGMTCGACAGSVASAAQSVPGVSRAEVDWKAGTAVVRYLAETTDPQAIAEAIRKAGYRATVEAQ